MWPEIRKSCVVGRSFADVLEYMIERCTPGEVELHAEVARKLWFQRNTVVHSGEFIHPNALLLLTSTYINEYRTSMDHGKRGDYWGVRRGSWNICCHTMETYVIWKV
jgi:hypothetical protein